MQDRCTYEERNHFITFLSCHVCAQAIQIQMRTECKCHGLSGSCTLRSCWRKMPLFRQVGDYLMQGFHAAVRVMGGNDGKSLVPIDPDNPPLDANVLIYSAESPDFCQANQRTGTEGTQGRVCNSTETGPGGCDSLCCGKGFADYTQEHEENCLCRFHWCCEVQCQRCSVRQDVSLCLWSPLEEIKSRIASAILLFELEGHICFLSYAEGHPQCRRKQWRVKTSPLVIANKTERYLKVRWESGIVKTSTCHAATCWSFIKRNKCMQK